MGDKCHLVTSSVMEFEREFSNTDQVTELQIPEKESLLFSKD